MYKIVYYKRLGFSKRLKYMSAKDIFHTTYVILSSLSIQIIYIMWLTMLKDTNLSLAAIFLEFLVKKFYDYCRN